MSLWHYANKISVPIFSFSGPSLEHTSLLGNSYGGKTSISAIGEGSWSEGPQKKSRLSTSVPDSSNQHQLDALSQPTNSTSCKFIAFPWYVWMSWNFLFNISKSFNKFLSKCDRRVYFKDQEVDDLSKHHGGKVKYKSTCSLLCKQLHNLLPLYPGIKLERVLSFGLGSRFDGFLTPL